MHSPPVFPLPAWWPVVPRRTFWFRRLYNCFVINDDGLEPRYSHHCYVRADDRHASAIGPIDQLPAGLVSASFLFIWIPSGELAAPTNYLPGSTDIPSLSWQLGSLLSRKSSRNLRNLETVGRWY